MKTDRQSLLEMQRQKPIADILRETLEQYRGQKQQVTLAGLDLGVTDATVYNWCADLDIDIDQYRDRVRAAGEGA